MGDSTLNQRSAQGETDEGSRPWVGFPTQPQTRQGKAGTGFTCAQEPLQPRCTSLVFPDTPPRTPSCFQSKPGTPSETHVQHDAEFTPNPPENSKASQDKRGILLSLLLGRFSVQRQGFLGSKETQKTTGLSRPTKANSANTEE